MELPRESHLRRAPDRLRADRTLRVVLVGMLREADWFSPPVGSCWQGRREPSIHRERSSARWLRCPKTTCPRSAWPDSRCVSCQGSTWTSCPPAGTCCSRTPAGSSTSTRTALVSYPKVSSSESIGLVDAGRARDTIDTWRQWVVMWDATPGDHRLQLRETDGVGQTQTPERTHPFPDGRRAITPSSSASSDRRPDRDVVRLPPPEGEA
jgi:hypothetical protein